MFVANADKCPVM